jgi:hypothetical protein
MADSPIFEWICQQLEEGTEFSGIEARGTVRIALKKSGLEAAALTTVQMQVVVKRVLPEELRRRGQDDGQSVCDQIATRLKDQNFAGGSDDKSPEAIFARLGS